jgi:tRNA A-37 threonylcarbamoyl transferase component Bud32
MNLPRPFGGRWRVVRGDPECAGWLVEPVLAWLQELRPGPGTEVVTTRRSSWVLRTEVNGRDFYCKVYVYPRWRDRCRGWLRNTWLARSRAAREADAMSWLRCHGFLAPRVAKVAELRRFGVLHAAMLVTEAVAGEPLDRALPRLAPDARARVLDSLRALVAALHAQGFRDRNLDLRNIILVARSEPPALAKIDSPRFCLVRPGATDDALARADWRRLEASLRQLGLQFAR